MRTATLSSHETASSDTYWNMLKNLSMDIKLDLIARLSNSLRTTGKDAHETFWAKDFAGKWQDDRTAEEIVEDIRNARTSKTVNSHYGKKHVPESLLQITKMSTNHCRNQSS